MPLTMARVGEINYIKKILGRDETTRFIQKLGFVEGEEVMVVSEIAGNIILTIKDSRVALDKGMANRILI